MDEERHGRSERAEQPRGSEKGDHESEGGHTWVNWREYLNEFAPQLFQ